jgi:DNA repair protein RadC
MSGKAKPVRSKPWKRQPDLVREPPPEERPRQRLLRSGGDALSDAELLSVVLANGGREVSALVRARKILDEAGGLDRLVGIRPSTFQRWRLGEARAAAVLAALEISRRVVHSEVPERKPMSRPGAVARYLVLRYAQRDQEVMGAVYLNTRHRLIAVSELFRGTVSRAAVEPREVLKEGLVRGACGVVLFHTHPSGDPSPSLEDLSFTRRMAEAGDAVGIRLIDHLILGDAESWVSLRDRGAW